MPKRDIVVIGASAGGIEALQEVIAGLPPDFSGSMLIVVHMPASGGKALQRILSRITSLDVVAAADRQPLVPGRIYVCVGDSHLMVGRAHIHVRQGPRENGHRPAADPLFRSASNYHGRRVVGVILSGTLSDGTAGLLVVRRHGGLAVIQDPKDAIYGGMPESALEYVGADYVVTAKEMGPLLARLATEEVAADQPVPDHDLRKEVEFMEGNGSALEADHPGQPSPWPCPDCHGVLWAIDDGPVLRFRCRVGHAWSADSLLQQQGEGVEAAMWMALRALEDRADLSRTLAERAEEGGRPLSAARFRDDLEGMSRSIAILRRMLGADHSGPATVPREPVAGDPDK
jgi:two-component system chemotaxis response regulator CheB